MSKECSIINDANGSESELYYKLIDALGSEKLAAEEYARVRGGFFKGTIEEPGVFGDWVAVQKLKDNPKNTQEIPHIGTVNPNGEPELFHDRTTDLFYYKDRNKDRHYINDRKFPLLRNEEVEEVTASLLFGFVNNNRKKDFNDFDEDTFLAKGEMISFIRGYVAAYKTKVLASDMTQEQKDEQIEAADLILDYEEDFKRAVIDNLESLGTKFRETVSNEVDEKSNDLQQTIRESYETSAKDSATANTKIMLSKIENVEEAYDDDGNFIGLSSIPGDFLGLSTFVEFNEVWNTLQPALSDIVAHGHGQSYIDVLSQMKAELKKVAKIKPWAQKLAQQLETMDQNKLNEFIQAFSKTKLNFYVTEVNGAEYKVINATSTTQADTQVSASWGLMFQTRHLDENGTLKEASRKQFEQNKELLERLEQEFSYSDKADPVFDTLQLSLSNIVDNSNGQSYLDLLSEMKTEIKKVAKAKPWAQKLATRLETMNQNDQYKFIQTLSWENVLSEEISESADSLLKILHSQGVHEELIDENGEYLERDGVTVDDLNQFIVLNGGVRHAAREFKRIIKAAKKTNEFVLAQPAKGFVTKGEWVNPFTQETAMKHLANAFTQRQNNITDNAILANEGKSYYPYSNPMYLSSKINEWKREIKAKSSEDNSPSALDRLAMRPENENSTWLAYLRGIDKGITRSSAEQRAVSLQRLSKLDMGLANSFKSKGKNNGVGNTDIQYGDAINDHITKLLGGRIKGGKSYFATITPADKGRRVELEGLPVFDTKTTLLDKETFRIRFSAETVDVAEGYFLDEYNRMRRVARENESLDPKEMVVHYHGKKGNGLKSQIFPELSHDSKNEEFEALRDSLYENGIPIGDLNSTVLTAAQKQSVRQAITNSMQQRIKETKEEIDKLTNVNSAIYKSYNVGGKKTRDQVYTAMAGDYFMNGLIATVEYSKMFSGDAAFYKNPSDLIKRIPATYTDGLQLRLGTSDELKFNTATINAIEGKSKYHDKIYESLTDKSIADAYLGVNVTDAQAWITPNRWKFLKRRLGQWSKFHDKVYDKMMKGETLKPNEIKIAAQPLKGVYFDLNQGRPVYLKYSQAVLVPSLVKNTPMQGLLDMMTKDKDGKPFINKSGKGGQNEIHEVITLDGVKVGAVAPTTVHDENHNLLEGEKLELNVVQLDNRGWKLQQDLPIKKIHDTNVGSQIQKNILEGLDLDGLYGKDGEITGDMLLQTIHDTVSGLSDHGKTELEQMFDIKDGKIQNEDKIYEELIQEFLSRGADDNVISALRKRTPFDAIPQIRGKVQSVLMSMFNKRLTKISTPGGSFIQVSPFGLETLRHEARIAKGTKAGRKSIVNSFENTKEFDELMDIRVAFDKDFSSAMEKYKDTLMLGETVFDTLVPEGIWNNGIIDPETGKATPIDTQEVFGKSEKEMSAEVKQKFIGWFNENAKREASVTDIILNGNKVNISNPSTPDEYMGALLKGLFDKTAPVVKQYVNSKEGLGRDMIDRLNSVGGKKYNYKGDIEEVKSKTTAKTGEFTLNEGQAIAKEEVLDFLNNKGGSNTMSLVGYAGTGKTTLLKNIFDEYQSENPFKDVIFSSPTHKANAVIKQKNPSYKIRTLHSLLGLRADMNLEEFDATDVKFDKKADSVMANVLVIDESSMINDELFELIKSSYPGTKIIFVGDDAQIQPVGQDSNSKALSSTGSVSFLNEVMRAEDNEVLDESMTVRETKDFSYQNKSKSGIEFTNNSEDFLTDAFKMFTSEEFKNDPLHARILAASNKQVRVYNEKIHKALFPEATDIFPKGAVLMAYANHAVDFRTKEPQIQNSSDYKVIDRGEPTTLEVEGLELSGFYITVQDLINPRKRSRLFSLDDKNDYRAIGKKHEEIRMAAIADRGGYKGWQRLSAFKDAFVPSDNVTHNGRTVIKKTFEAGYSHTVHKSQGSTYQNVFVDETNIDNTFANKKELKAQLKYVAVTRAAKKAVILTQKEIENIPTPVAEKQVEEVETEETEEQEDELQIGTDILSGIKIVSDNYDGNGLQPPRIDQETGEVLRGQVFMPHSEIVKLLKDIDGGKDWMSMTGQEIMKYLTPEVLQIISYRIPNQGMSSNDALEIVGILPPEMGDSIIGYDGIPAKTGSDFDIDKMYVMTRNIELRDGKVRVTEDAVGSKKELQNRLVDLYEMILLDPKTYDKMMTSIDGAFLKEDIAGTKDNPDMGLFPAPEMANMEMFSPIRQMKTKFEYLSGQTGVGKTAVHLVDHASNQSLNIRLNTFIGIGKSVRNKDGKLETSFDKGTFSDKSISETLSAFLNAYVDIAKDPYISRANHNDTTSPVTFMLIRAGVDLKWINRFIGQPILKEVVEGAKRYMSITSASGGMSESAALDRSVADVRKKYKLEISDKQPKKIIAELDAMEMEVRIRNTDKPLGSQQDADVLTSFMYLLANAKNFNESVAAARADTKGGRGSFVERKVAANKVLLVREKNNVLGFDEKFEGTALGTYHYNSVTWVGEVLTKSNLFWAGGEHFDKALDYASHELKGTDILESADFGSKAENSAASYLMSGTELFSDITEDPRYLFQKLGKEIMDLKETSDNFLIKELQVSKFDNKNFLTIDNNNKPKLYKNKIYSQWLELYADPATKKLALDLVRYSYAATGFQSKLGSFFAHVPHEILRDEGVTRDVRKIGKELDKLASDPNYISQMARHMAEDPSVVKRVSPDNTDMRFGVNVRNGAFVLGNENGSPAFVSAMIDGEVALYRLHGYIDSTGGVVMRDGVYIRTHKLGMKESKGGAVEYQYNTESRKSSFEANNLTKKDKNAMSIFLKEIKKDGSFRTLGAGKTQEKDVEINSEDQAKKVGNTKEAPKQAPRSKADIEASAQMEMNFEKDSVSSPETEFEGSEETATFLSLDIIKANMAKIKKDNDITENNCDS